MRRLQRLLRILPLVTPVALACTPSSSSSPAGADASPSAAASSPPPVASSAVIATLSIPPAVNPNGAPAASASGTVPAQGAPCSPGKDSIVCSPDQLSVLTCAGGVWRTLQACRGPARCKGMGSALTCDTGIPQPGDDCVPAKSEPQCRSAHESIACSGGKWIVSPCRAGTTCIPARGGTGTSGCK
jgi:hypothetical protein